MRKRAVASPKVKRTRRVIELLVDDTGEVLVARFDHHREKMGITVRVPWPETYASRMGAVLLRATYLWPPPKKRL